MTDLKFSEIVTLLQFEEIIKTEGSLAFEEIVMHWFVDVVEDGFKEMIKKSGYDITDRQ